MKKIIKKGILIVLVTLVFLGSFSTSFIPGTASIVQAKTAGKKIKLNCKNLMLRECDNYKLKLKNADGKITWKSSNKEIATVNKKGNVKAKKEGTATITARFDGKKYKCTVTVLPETPDPVFPVSKKPVIYFYPETDNYPINAYLSYDGTFSTVYPAFTDAEKNGWEFTADTDGTIHLNGNEYGYLFWEGTSNRQFHIDRGYCVAKADLVPFLEEKLTSLGLNSREKNDFITYWLPCLNQNAYNIISFDTAEYTETAKLTVNPHPDTMIRVYMNYKASDKPVEIEAPVPSPSPARKGFTVVEWGGSELH